MQVEAIAEGIGAKVLTNGMGESFEIARVYASDRIADLLHEVDDHTLLVTNLSHPLLMRPIELMDVAAICFLNGAKPQPEFLEAAKRRATVIMVSPACMYETCGRLHQLLNAKPSRSTG